MQTTRNNILWHDKFSVRPRDKNGVGEGQANWQFTPYAHS